MSNLDTYLTELVAEASGELPEVSTRRMFGSQAFFANGSIFALIWDGRIALRMPDPAQYDALYAMPGASTWNPMPDRERPMSKWVLVTEDFHDDLDALRPWVELAHKQALLAPKKKAKATKRAKATQKKPARSTKKRR